MEQCDNLILIKIWCRGCEGHNDGLCFQSGNLYGTTAEEQNLPVNPSKMLILLRPPRVFEDEVIIEIFLHITESLLFHGQPLGFLQLPFTLSVFVVRWFVMIVQQTQYLAEHKTQDVSFFCDMLVSFTTQMTVLKGFVRFNCMT